MPGRFSRHECDGKIFQTRGHFQGRCGTLIRKRKEYGKKD